MVHSLSLATPAQPVRPNMNESQDGYPTITGCNSSYFR